MNDAIAATSSDGTLTVSLVPTRDGRVAVLQTLDGCLRGDDYYITIHDLFSTPETQVEARAAAAPTAKPHGPESPAP